VYLDGDLAASTSADTSPEAGLTSIAVGLVSAGPSSAEVDVRVDEVAVGRQPIPCVP
jgi:hypothetical protein